MAHVIKICFTSDNENMALAEIKSSVNAIDGLSVINIEVVSSDRACRNGYGKEVSEEEFEAIDPSSEEAWFDDYDFVFNATIETSLTKDETEDLLIENGISVDEE